MAVDEALLLDAAEQGVATLRFYGWNEPTLSLGYFQRAADREQHAASRACTVVRRQTGGGAILHDRELTYSIALPAHHSLARHHEALYTTVHEGFMEVLAARLFGRRSAWTLMRHEPSGGSATEKQFLCFERRTRGDIVVTAAPEGGADWKILGSAQRRYRGALLQHGSLLLETSPAAPELSGFTELTACEFSLGAGISELSVRLAELLAFRLSESQLPTISRAKAAELAKCKYAAAAWTNRL